MIKTSHIKTIKDHIYFAALIGLGFLWTGTAYIIQAYRMLAFMDGGTVNLFVCGVYYVCQAAGIGAVGLLFAKRAPLAGGRALPLLAAGRFPFSLLSPHLFSWQLPCLYHHWR